MAAKIDEHVAGESDDDTTDKQRRNMDDGWHCRLMARRSAQRELSR
jgi:hypothetical protein